MDSVPTVEELKKLRVVDLKERLGKLGKSTSGLKAELIDRLYNALSEQAGNVDMVPPTGPLASYSQVENLQQMPQMNPESPVVEVTIDAAQFDCGVEQPQVHHEVYYRHQQEEVERLRIQQQQEEEMIRRHRQQEIQREQEEMERQRLQHEEIIRRQQEEAERQRQQQEAERLRQQQEEAEILRRQQEEAELVRRQQEEAEILRRQQEAEQALLHQNEMERLRREQQETELLRLQEQEAEILRRQQEETELLRRQEEAKFLRQQHEERVRLEQEEAERLRRSELLKYQQEEAERVRWEQEEADRLQREENERIRLQQEATEFRRLQELEATQAQQRESELLRRRNEEEAEIRRRQEEEADLLWHLHQRSGMEAAANRVDDSEPLNLKCADDNEATLQYQRQLEISGRLRRQQEEQEEMDMLRKQQEDAERERQIKIQEEMEQERQRKLQEEEIERENQRILQEEEAERERQRKLLEEAAERERQRRLQEEAEKERQRKLQEEEEEERERQRRIQEETERERQKKLREEEERERQKKLREEEEERERQKKLREEEEERERQEKLREEEEERERQKKLREEAERERLKRLQEMAERLKKLQEEEAERERQRQLQEAAERRRKQEEDEKERQRKLQEELERQRKLEEEELHRKEEEARILQAKREEEERVRKQLELEEQERQRQIEEEEERLKREKELQQRQMKEAEEARLKKLYDEEQERLRLKKEEEEMMRRRKIEEEQRLQKEKMEEEKRLQMQKDERQLTEEQPVDVSMGIGPLPPPPPPPSLDTLGPTAALSMAPLISEGVVYPSPLQMVPNILQPWPGVPAQGYQQPMMMDVMPGFGAPIHQFPQASPPPSSSPPPIPGLGPPSPSHGKLDQLGKPPALMSLDIQKPTDEMLEDDLRLPQALEKILALKIERAQMLGVDPDVIPASETHDDDQIKEPNAEEEAVEAEDAVGARPPQPESKEPKPSKNKQRKMKKKKRAHRRRDIEHIREITMEDATGEKEAELDVEVQYISDSLDLNPADPMYSHFMKIFEAFKLTDPEAARREAEEEANRAKLETKKEPDLRKKPKDADEEPEEEPKKEEQPKLSKRKLKKLNRLSIAELKQHVCRPDVVEMHDVTAKDPKLLVLLKSTRNTVPVPRHWCFKRKFLQGKRGIEKPPFNLPDFIKKTGIMEMRQALQEKEDQKTLKAKMRERVRPKMGKIDIDYQKLHDAFFKWQTKPKMTIHGDLYYEGKEFETRLKEKKPGELSDELRTALGMPIGANAHKVPPPWLIAMQRYGPPPSYPNLKIPGLNSPIPEGCAFGYHAGGWGKPPVDEMGKPLYGDVFGMQGGDYQQSLPEEEVDRTQWGELESESESESEEEEEEEEEEEQEEEDAGEEPDKGGLVTPAEGGLVTPSGLSSIPVGMETPDMIELRKRKIESEMEGGETPALYTILPEKKTDRIGGAMMGSTHVYDIAAAVPGRPRIGGANPVEGGVEVALDPSELDLDTATMTARYEQTLREQQNQLEKEDLSDMVAEHSAKQKNKRKRAAGEQHIGRAIKKYKDFKF